MKQRGICIAALAAAVAAWSLCPPEAMAQLTPERLYNGVNRSIPVRVDAPDAGAGGSQDIQIALLTPGENAEAARAHAAPGRVDLAALFPVLWTRREPGLLYAQLIVDGERVGPGLVLQPMLTPRRAVDETLRSEIIKAHDARDRARILALLDPLSRERSQAGGLLSFAPYQRGEPVYSGLRAYTDRHIVFETSLGEFEIALRPEHAPNTCFNMIHLVEGGFFTDIAIHRIVPASESGHPFVFQFGDPAGRGVGGPGYSIDAEQSLLDHDFGVVSMARGREPDSGGSQIFVCLSREGTSFLDGQYTSFAQTVRGAATLMSIENVPVSGTHMDTPVEAPIVRRARTVPAPPRGEGPEPARRPTPTSDER